MSRGSHMQSAESTNRPDDMGQAGAPTWVNLDPNDIGFLANAAGNFGAGSLDSTGQRTGQKQSRSGMNYAPTSSF
jgi:hypothetical protein